jgi:hypothetical protein
MITRMWVIPFFALALARSVFAQTPSPDQRALDAEQRITDRTRLIARIDASANGWRITERKIQGCAPQARRCAGPYRCGLATGPAILIAAALLSIISP